MPLSIKKFEKFMFNNGIISNNFFTNSDNICLFVEAICLKTTESFIISIPSKYKMSIENSSNVFKITKNAVPNREDTIDEYTTLNRKIYEPIDLNNENKDTSETYMEQRYNKPIILEETKKDRSMYRQIKRLGFCLNGLFYKLALIKLEDIYFINNEHQIIHYKIKDYTSKQKYRKIFVTINIEYLFEHTETISNDITTIKKSIFNIIEKNMETNMKNFKDKWSENKNIKDIETTINNKQIEYTNRLIKVNKTLDELNEEEMKILEKKSDLENVIGMKVFRSNFARDLELTRNTRPLEIKLTEINNNKKELIRNILSLKTKLDNIMLSSDETIFVINVLTNSIQSYISTFKIF